MDLGEHRSAIQRLDNYRHSIDVRSQLDGPHTCSDVFRDGLHGEQAGSTPAASRRETAGKCDSVLLVNRRLCPTPVISQPTRELSQISQRIRDTE